MRRSSAPHSPRGLLRTSESPLVADGDVQQQGPQFEVVHPVQCRPQPHVIAGLVPAIHAFVGVGRSLLVTALELCPRRHRECRPACFPPPSSGRREGEHEALSRIRPVRDPDGRLQRAVGAGAGAVEDLVGRPRRARPDQHGGIRWQTDGRDGDRGAERTGLRRYADPRRARIDAGQVQAVAEIPEPLLQVGVLVEQVPDRRADIVRQAGQGVAGLLREGAQLAFRGLKVGELPDSLSCIPTERSSRAVDLRVRSEEATLADVAALDNPRGCRHAGRRRCRRCKRPARPAARRSRPRRGSRRRSEWPPRCELRMASSCVPPLASAG